MSDELGGQPNDWHPSATLARLQQRADWIRWLRNYFWDRGFWEVETPLLSRETVVDRYLDPPLVQAGAMGLGGTLKGDWYLQTSPEFGMKRLLAAGAERIFQVGKAFRAGELGRLHNPEFTMLEWYDSAADYEQGMSFLQELASAFFETAACERIAYGTAWSRGLGAALGMPDDEARRVFAGGLAELVKVVGRLPGTDIRTLVAWDRDSLLNLVWTECVEPTLGADQPVVVFDWPATQAALAKTRETTSGAVAERFELYFRGVELANGYHELVDSAVLAQRSQLNNQLRNGDGKPRLPEESRLGQAMSLQPRLGAGVAAGVDRWLMLKLGASSLAEVLAFSAERA